MANATQDEKGLAKQGGGTPIKGDLLTKPKGKGDALSETIDFRGDLEEQLGIRTEAPVEVLQTGGITKWVDIKGFMADPSAPDGKPCKGNGLYITGLMLGRHEMEDDENGEVDPDTGKKMRSYYNIRLAKACPVSFKDENRADVREMAQPKEIVALGERYALRNELRKIADDVNNGAIIAVAILPDERIKVSPSRTMWTFKIEKIVIRHAPKLVTSRDSRAPF